MLERISPWGCHGSALSPWGDYRHLSRSQLLGSGRRNTQVVGGFSAAPARAGGVLGALSYALGGDPHRSSKPDRADEVGAIALVGPKHWADAGRVAGIVVVGISPPGLHDERVRLSPAERRRTVRLRTSGAGRLAHVSGAAGRSDFRWSASRCGPSSSVHPSEEVSVRS